MPAPLVIRRHRKAPRALVWAVWSDPAHLLRGWARFVYEEISPPSRLRFTNSFTDDQRNIQLAPFPGDWPVQIAYTVTFDEVEGGTLLTLEGEAHAASPAEIAFYAASLGDMEKGFAGTFDPLEAYLADVA